MAVILAWSIPAWAVEPVGGIRLASKELSGTVGQPVQIAIEPTEKPLPSGFMYTVVADSVSFPGAEPPALLSGMPITTFTGWLPGEYRVRLRGNLVNKTSCGGASFLPLLDEEVRVILHASDLLKSDD